MMVQEYQQGQNAKETSTAPMALSAFKENVSKSKRVTPVVNPRYQADHQKERFADY